jgi:hypothetical protein
MTREKITEEMGIHKEWMKEAEQMTKENLLPFIEKLLTKYEHDYGTICHATAAAAIAAAWSVARDKEQGGITGFQAGAVMWEMIRGWGTFGDGPKKMMLYKNMLFPQYEYAFEKTIDKDTWEYLQKEARVLLSEKNELCSKSVLLHWQSIADGVVPFGYKVEAE